MVASTTSHSTPPPASVALVDLRPATSHEDRSPRQKRSTQQPPRAFVTTLADPCTNESRQYLSLKNSGSGGGSPIYEINALSAGSAKYSSFFVGPRVVSSGSLSVGTAVDPLFFVLASARKKMDQSSAMEQRQGGDGKRKWKWQPLEQALDDLAVPHAVRRALGCDDVTSSDDGDQESCRAKQLLNLFDVTDQFGDDMLLYKFSEDRAMKWLEAKHARTLSATRDLALATKKREAEARKYRDEACGGNGAFSVGFVADDADGKEGEEKKEEEPIAGATDGLSPADNCLTKEEENSAQVAALQFVCGYLGEAWRGELVRKLDMKADDLLSEREKRKRAQQIQRRKELEEGEDVRSRSTDKLDKEGIENKSSAKGSNKKRKLEENISSVSSESDRLMQYALGADGAGGADTAKAKEEEVKKARLGGAKSAGLKRLAKVNVKGMKSLASFFGGGGAKKAKKQ